MRQYLHIFTANIIGDMFLYISFLAQQHDGEVSKLLAKPKHDLCHSSFINIVTMSHFKKFNTVFNIDMCYAGNLFIPLSYH